MKKYERMFYLVTILGLILKWSADCAFFANHYALLEGQLDYIMSHTPPCKNECRAPVTQRSE